MADNNTALGGQQKQLKMYKRPVLEFLGDLRTITLGGSPGVNDSGAGTAVPYFPKTGSIDFPDQDDVI